ncbi:MAG: dihydroxyacetone kinase subunit DhaL [Methylovulum sp.]|uniref:dihydroxyacetone kinase subunit DhaL n=1 Tax=Methylovulum sp. TaxID=1916980 RepID=UPI0026164FE0|nr:dihydroxyacetone kinase subunit DhaL [Methylovulum sp.]MDD2724471.1 dihydroxyacetone kinase subunit DhaL [Methylovulum sp.]MDD5125467.1 dihydroxyacetone kinase subunit DhaL [Methylovulum sp.]
MTYATALLPQLIEAIADAINQNAGEVTALDQAIGDGDHVVNLQRGIHALMEQRHELVLLDWVAAWQKIGMTLMSTVGGASGSLLGTLFVAMAKAGKGQILDAAGFAAIFNQGVESMKQRGKSDAGEKTMLDVLVPVANYLQASAKADIALAGVLAAVQEVALAGVESTRDMVATKGRASFLEARTLGHIDAGAKTSQLIICAICPVLSASPA